MKRLSIVTAAVLSMLLWASQVSYAQVGRDSTLWSWTIAAEHHDAIVGVSVDDGKGTGVIIRVDRDKPVRDGFEGYCLTAFHVVEKDQDRREIMIHYRNGRTAAKCMVVKSDPELDVAILWVWVPAHVKPAPIARSSALRGDSIEFAGLGGTTDPICCLRSFSATVAAPTTDKTIYADVALLPGDSGGPVFNATHEVVGVISGGWFWWDGGILTDAGDPIPATWPARAANVNAFQMLVSEISNDSTDVAKALVDR